MTSSFSIRLQAQNRSRNVARHYALDVTPDLFGSWIIEISYGRIGSRGRQQTLSAVGRQEARQVVRSRLQRRSTLPYRVGARYKVERIEGDAWWMAPR